MGGVSVGEGSVHGEGIVRVVSEVPPAAATDQVDSRSPPSSATAGQVDSTSPPSTATAGQVDSTSPPSTATASQVDSTSSPSTATAAEFASAPRAAQTTRNKFDSTSLISIARTRHAQLPGIRRIPLPALGIIALIAVINVGIWIVVGAILHFHPALISTALLSYTFGLRHALDADHISAIDLMTRRLIASGHRPVTVGTFFSLGHSTIVVVTSIAVAATAAAVENKFDGFGTVGGIIGTAVSAAFLILLGIMNAYILYRLVKHMKKVLNLSKGEEEQAWKVEGGGCLFSVLKRMFKIIDRPWKMYPLGVLFGLGFDTSSEIALLGISSIEASKGTSIWLILIFPVLFTAGMCLIDTMDGALMLTVYILPTEKFADGADGTPLINPRGDGECEEDGKQDGAAVDESTIARRAKDPVAFLYYSIVLTTLTVMVALVIGTLQLLSLILNTANPTGPFWDGVQTAGDYYDVIGGSICGSFIVVGALSVLCYKPWRRWVDKPKRERDVLLDAAAEKKLEDGDGLPSSATIAIP